MLCSYTNDEPIHHARKWSILYIKFLPATSFFLVWFLSAEYILDITKEVLLKAASGEFEREQILSISLL